MLDHEASDASLEVFRQALHDPVPRVRTTALHGLVCHRCRTGELCPGDVVDELARLVRHDASTKVRHAAVVASWPFSGQADLRTALAAVARDDPDELVRTVASAVLAGDDRGVRSRKALRRRS